MAKRIRLENTEGKWWHCDKLDIYARNGYLATCERLDIGNRRRKRGCRREKAERMGREIQ